MYNVIRFNLLVMEEGGQIEIGRGWTWFWTGEILKELEDGFILKRVLYREYLVMKRDEYYEVYIMKRESV